MSSIMDTTSFGEGPGRPGAAGGTAGEVSPYPLGPGDPAPGVAPGSSVGLAPVAPSSAGLGSAARRACSATPRSSSMSLWRASVFQ